MDKTGCEWGSKNIVACRYVVRRRLCKQRSLLAKTDTHATTKDLLEVVFSVRSLARLYNEEQHLLRESLDAAVRRVGDWCETAVSLRGCEPRNVHW
jgi:hypothetical protein